MSLSFTKKDGPRRQELVHALDTSRDLRIHVCPHNICNRSPTDWAFSTVPLQLMSTLETGAHVSTPVRCEMIISNKISKSQQNFKIMKNYLALKASKYLYKSESIFASLQMRQLPFFVNPLEFLFFFT